MGRRVHTAQQASDFVIKPRFTKLLKLFMAQSRQLLKFASEDSSCLIRAAPSRTRPLQRLGIESFMPMLSCRMALGPEAALRLNSCPCMMQGRKFIGGKPTKLAVGKFKPPSLIPPQRLSERFLLKQAASKLESIRDDHGARGVL